MSPEQGSWTERATSKPSSSQVWASQDRPLGLLTNLLGDGRFRKVLEGSEKLKAGPVEQDRGMFGSLLGNFRSVDFRSGLIQWLNDVTLNLVSLCLSFCPPCNLWII